MSLIDRQCNQLGDQFKKARMAWNDAQEVWNDRTQQTFGNEYWRTIEDGIQQLIEAAEELSRTMAHIRDSL